MTRSPARPGLLAVLAALALVLAACGSDDEAQTPAPAATAAATPDPSDLRTRPVIATPAGEPPARLVKRDIVKGTGRAAKAGDQVTVQYVGAAFSTGEEFDASWNTGQAFPFALGAGAVIPGWDAGVAGMRKGGRRELTIPPEQAYGAQGSPPAIGPDETLIFVVDMVDVQAGP